jgi:hypothetical protein
MDSKCAKFPNGHTVNDGVFIVKTTPTGSLVPRTFSMALVLEGVPLKIKIM